LVVQKSKRDRMARTRERTTSKTQLFTNHQPRTGALRNALSVTLLGAYEEGDSRRLQSGPDRPGGAPIRCEVGGTSGEKKSNVNSDG